METLPANSAAAPLQTIQHDPAPRRGQRRGGPRGPRGAGRGGSLAMRPASVNPTAPPSSDDLSSGPDSSSRTGQPRRTRGNRGNRSRIVNGRQFGGSLTQANATQSVSQGSALQAEAIDFVPGQTPVNKATIKGGSRPQKRRYSKSQAPDIATRTHEDIDHSQYECPICTSEVQRNSKVWSCHTCWTVFHLSCIKKWSTNQGSAATTQQPEDGITPRLWRCPGCNLPKETLPKSYTCWCEKETDPRSLPGLPPHSCGQSCGRERARKCPHPCALICHAGPCPPCTHVGPTQMCFCGRHDSTKQCSETDYIAGWSCGEICGELMPCGEHTCPRPCHEGLCGACEERIPAKCYCGQVDKDILCAERGDEKTSHRTHLSTDGEKVAESWTGLFECPNTCNRSFDCGKHTCQQACHAQNDEDTHCPYSPDVLTHCSCGKMALSDIPGSTRTSCSDPVVSCNEPCGKTLPCGHSCTQICHIGNCSSCMQVVNITCRCGRTTSSTICHQGQEEKPQCRRPCRINLNCGRHACDERCCEGERKAIERQSQKRKQKPLHAASRPTEDGFEAEHICTRQCGRLLKCGNHICEELCHKGPCGSCREAIFDEISCHCGRTVLQPPLPCGTEAPPCRYLCERLKACGHPQVPHTCHGEEATCPKCPYLMEKPCMCGKKRLKNQQCWLQDVRCGEICGKKLRCGSHFCRKPCHRAGECEDAGGVKCQQPCGKLKKLCEHPDDQPCHAPFPCAEDKPCQSKIFITCECQAQKQETKCGACRGSEGNLDKKLPCSDECARLERNRKLALALNIDQTNHLDDHIPYSTDTLKIFAANVKWAQTHEREFRVFATSDEERRMRFKPMKSHEREFLHHLAEDFGFDSESMDPEPHRHVMIWKSPRFVSAPNKTLAEALRIRQSKQLTNSAPQSDHEGSKKVITVKPRDDPYNGFLVTRPRFGLTIDELAQEVHSIAPGEHFDIEFLPSEEVVIKSSSSSAPEDIQQRLVAIKPTLATNVAAKQLGVVQLCSLDSSLNVLRKESDSVAAQDGWSRVAAKKSAPRGALPNASTAGSSNSFSVLTGNKITFSAKKKPAKVVAAVKAEDIVDDWEAALDDEESAKQSMEVARDENHLDVHSSRAADQHSTAAVADATTPDH